MSRPGSLILIHFLQPIAKNVVISRKNYPLHLTVMPWFHAASGAEEKVFNTVKNLADQTAPFKFKIEGQAMFGPDNDVPVNLVAKNPALKKFHSTLAAALEASGATIESEYVKTAYRPHVSHNQTEQAHVGETYNLTNLTFLRLLPDKITCQTVKTYFLKG